MICDHARPSFEDYLDGALPAIERAALDQHFSACTSCRIELHKLRALRCMLTELPAPTAAPGTLDSILRAAVRIPVSYPRRWQHPRWFAGGLAAAAALLLGVGVRLGMDIAGEKSAIPAVTMAARPVELDGTVRQVALLFRATDPVHDADISVWLPQDVEIEGRPHLRHISWHIDLKPGSNVLQLPLVATGSHNGTLVVQVAGGSLLRRLEVPISMRAVRGPSGATGGPAGLTDARGV